MKITDVWLFFQRMSKQNISTIEELVFADGRTPLCGRTIVGKFVAECGSITNSTAECENDIEQLNSILYWFNFYYSICDKIYQIFHQPFWTMSSTNMS